MVNKSMFRQTYKCYVDSPSDTFNFTSGGSNLGRVLYRIANGLHRWSLGMDE